MNIPKKKPPRMTDGVWHSIMRYVIGDNKEGALRLYEGWAHNNQYREIDQQRDERGHSGPIIHPDRDQPGNGISPAAHAKERPPRTFTAPGSAADMNRAAASGKSPTEEPAETAELRGREALRQADPQGAEARQQARQAQAERQQVQQEAEQRLTEAKYGPPPQGTWDTDTRMQQGAARKAQQQTPEQRQQAEEQRQAERQKALTAQYAQEYARSDAGKQQRHMNTAGAFSGAGSFTPLMPSSGGQRRNPPQGAPAAGPAGGMAGGGPAPGPVPQAAPPGGGTYGQFFALNGETGGASFAPGGASPEGDKIVEFQGKHYKESDLNNTITGGLKAAFSTSLGDAEAATQLYSGVFKDMIEQSKTDPGLAGMLNGLPPEAWPETAMNYFLDRPLPEDILDRLAGIKGRGNHLVDAVMADERVRDQLPGKTVRELVDLTNLQNTLQGGISGKERGEKGAESGAARTPAKITVDGKPYSNAKGGTASLTADILFNGKTAQITMPGGSAIELNKENYREVMQELREQDPKGWGKYEQRGAKPPELGIAEAELPAPAPPETRIVEEYQGEIKGGAGWDFYAPRADRQGHTSNVDLANMRCGINAARQERLAAVQGGQEREAALRFQNGLDQQGVIIREKFRNIPDQGKRAEALNVFAREQRQRLAADPSLTPRQRFINQSVLDQYLTQLEGQMQKDGIQTQIETGRVNMGNTAAAISARALSGEADAGKSITDAAAAINGAAQWLSPAELNKAAQDAFAGIGQSLIGGHLTKLLEDSAGNPIANTAALEAQFQGIYSRMIGAAGEMLGEDRLDILRVQAAESLSKARQGLQEHNADFFRGVQARYENALAQGDEGTAAALQRAYAGTPAQAIRRGDLRDRDALSMSGYLKPVVPRGDGTGNRNIAAAGQVTAAMQSIKDWYAGLGGLPAAEAAEQILADRFAKYPPEQRQYLNPEAERRMIQEAAAPRIRGGKGFTVFLWGAARDAGEFRVNDACAAAGEGGLYGAYI